MLIKWSRTGWLVCAAAAFTLMASGCFQPAGAGLEATNLADAQLLPTFTPVPTDIPTETPIPTVTETPSPEVTVITATPSIAFDATATLQPGVVTATPSPMTIADAGGAQDIEPIWQTATAIFLQQSGIDPGIQILPTATTDPGFIDPLLLTATQLVIDATNSVAIPLTQTAAAILGPTATFTPPLVIQPTQQPVVVLPGNDCEHQVQVTDRNLYRLGLEYGIHYLDIAYYPLNNIVNPNLIYIGQKIIIPGCGTTGKIPPPTWTPTATSSIPTYTGGGAGTAYPTFTGNYPTFTGSPVNYTVQAGDTLFRLSLRFGLPISSIVARNPQITNINLIYVGDTIVIG